MLSFRRVPDVYKRQGEDSHLLAVTAIGAGIGHLTLLETKVLSQLAL